MENLNRKFDLFYLVVFSVVLNIVVYYGFVSAYNNLTQVQSIPEQYYSSVYRYRVLSREILEMVFDLVQKIFHGEFPSKSYILSKGSPFYHTLFIINTFFSVLSLLLLEMIFSLKSFFSIDRSIKLLLLVVLVALSALSQYVVTFYDHSALFFLLLSIYFILKYQETRQFSYLLILSVLIGISTLNRETSALSLSFLLAVLLKKRTFSFIEIKGVTKTIALPFLSFILVYLLLRTSDSEGSAIMEGIYIKENLTQFNNLSGLLFAIIVIRIAYRISKTEENKSLITRFLFFSSPYLLMLLLVGILWEIRLFIPLVFGSFILSQIKLKNTVLN
ncbi:MAG: hypothetical protein KBA33_05300 [Cloacibacterium sp.]|nr:hypothetical protein [Cloacibacterium sp.]